MSPPVPLLARLAAVAGARAPSAKPEACGGLARGAPGAQAGHDVRERKRRAPRRNQPGQRRAAGEHPLQRERRRVHDDFRLHGGCARKLVHCAVDGPPARAVTQTIRRPSAASGSVARRSATTRRRCSSHATRCGWNRSPSSGPRIALRTAFPANRDAAAASSNSSHTQRVLGPTSWPRRRSASTGVRLLTSSNAVHRSAAEATASPRRQRAASSASPSGTVHGLSMPCSSARLTMPGGAHSGECAFHAAAWHASPQ
jgi:hypothetical protein